MKECNHFEVYSQTIYVQGLLNLQEEELRQEKRNGQLQEVYLEQNVLPIS
jgi:hypothetical protein